MTTQHVEEEKTTVELTDFSAEFLKSLESIKGIETSQTFKDFIHKEEITFVIYLGESSDGVLKFVTTSNDGFIKMNEVDLRTSKYTCKKSLFVCQAGISAAC